MRKFYICVFALLTLLIVYSVAWFAAANQIAKVLPLGAKILEANGIIIDQYPQEVAGFPGWPRVDITGTVIFTQHDVIAVFPTASLSLRLFPFPGLYFNADQGFTLSPAYAVNAFTIALALPKSLPTSFDYAELERWAQEGGNIPVKKLHIRYGDLVSDGEGTVSLDKNMQLSMTIQTKTQGLDSVIAELVEKKVIDTQKALMTQSLLQLFHVTDAETGETFMPLPIRIQNSGVFLGPVRVATMSPIVWPDKPPAPGQ